MTGTLHEEIRESFDGKRVVSQIKQPTLVHPGLKVSNVITAPYQSVKGSILMRVEISCKPSRKMTTDSKTILAGFQSDSTELKYSRWGKEDVGDSEEWGEPTAPRPLVKI